MINIFKKEYKHTCKVCKKEFELKKEDKYIVAEDKGVVNIMNGVKYYECFDCPECGCQNIVNIREGSNESTRRNKKD